MQVAAQICHGDPTYHRVVFYHLSWYPGLLDHYTHNPVTPAKAGIQLLYKWIPASAGMTILINASMGPSKIPASAGMTFRQFQEKTFKQLEERTVKHLEFNKACSM